MRTEDDGSSYMPSDLNKLNWNEVNWSSCFKFLCKTGEISLSSKRKKSEQIIEKWAAMKVYMCPYKYS